MKNIFRGQKTSLLIVAFHLVLFAMFSASETTAKVPRWLNSWVTQPLTFVDRSLLSLKFLLRGPEPPSGKVAIVGVNEPDLGSIETKWPWSRDIMAEIIEEIFRKGAKTVAIDIVFSGRETHISEYLELELRERGLKELVQRNDPNDALLKTFFRHRKNIVLGWNTYAPCRSSTNDCSLIKGKDLASFESFKKFGKKGPQSHAGWSFLGIDHNYLPYEQTVESAGYFNAFKEKNGHVIAIPMAIEQKGYWFSSLSLAGVQNFQPTTLHHTSPPTLQSGEGKKIPLNSSLELQINHLGPEGTIPTYSIGDLFSDDFEADKFKDSLVFFGVTAETLLDMVTTPFDAYVPGIEVHATLADNLLSKNTLIRPVSSLYILSFLFAILITGLFLLTVFSKLKSFALFSSVFSFSLAIVFLDLMFFSQDLSLPTFFIYSLLSTVTLYEGTQLYLKTENDKKFLREAFSRYVSSELVSDIVADPKRLKLGGEKRELTILFSDIRGFTTLSENMNPESLALFLNDYLTLMTNIIQSHNGTLDKYIGDAIMAFWGAPIENQNHANDAVGACIDMMRCLDEHRERLESEYGARLEVGVGLNTGPVSVGNMGSQAAFNYTVLGDDVNLASRLEGLTKFYSSQMLISESTFQQLSEELKAHCRRADVVLVKGKTEAITIYDVQSQPIDAGSRQSFEKATEYYISGDWKAAQSHYYKLNDPVSRAMRRRLEDSQSESPPGWTGVWEFTSK